MDVCPALNVWRGGKEAAERREQLGAALLFGKEMKKPLPATLQAGGPDVRALRTHTR